MKALILGDAHAAELQPLSLTLPPLMTPLGGRSIGTAILQSLVVSGVQEVVIASSRFDRRLEDHLGDGGRFGLSLGYAMRERGESWLATLSRLNEHCGFCNTQVLVIEGAVYSDFDARVALASHLHSGSQTTEIVQPDGSAIGMRLVEPISVEAQDGGSAGAYTLQRPALRLDRFSEFYSRTLQAIAGGLPDFSPNTAEVVPGVHSAVGVVADWSKIQVQGSIVVGAMSEIAADVRLIGPAIIGRNCVIEPGCTVDSSIIESQTRLQANSVLTKNYAGGRGRWNPAGEPVVDGKAETCWADQPVRLTSDRREIAPDLAALASRVSMSFLPPLAGPYTGGLDAVGGPLARIDCLAQ